MASLPQQSFMEKVLYSEMQISEEVRLAVADLGWVEASAIQAEAIPVALTGRDVIGQAQTGTGKTGAFGIPAIELVNPSSRDTQVIILCPTRELCVQVAEQLKKLASYKRGVIVEAIYGGDSIDRQIRSLKKGCQIVVGTPGRVIDHLERKTLILDKIQMAVLDEADEMLDMGFREDIENILEKANEDRQTLLFSATMSKPILQITKSFQRDPYLVKVVKKEVTNDNIEQVYFAVKREAKLEVMCRLIDVHDIKLLLVFCNTKAKVDEVVEQLQVRGYQAEGIHGDLRQAQRNNVMSKFRAGTTTILVATDVAARGIDVKGVDAVINYDIPLDEEYYVHRIGRTGRAGKSGKAFTLVVGSERVRLKNIEGYTKVQIEKGVIPSFSDIVGVRKARFVEQVKSTIQEGDTALFDDVLELLKHEGFQSHQIVAALVKLSMGIERNEFSDANLAEEGRSGNRYEERRGGDRDSRGGRFGDRDRGGDSRGGSRFGDRDRGGDSRGGSRFGDRERSGDDRGGSRFGDRERGGDRDRAPRPASGREGMTRLFVSLGRKDGVSPNHIVGAIASEARIAGRDIGQIDIYDKFSFVEVPQNDTQTVLKAMNGNTINGKTVSLEVAK